MIVSNCYGMGGAKLCRRLGLQTKWIEKDGRQIEVAGEEGDAIIKKFHAMVPFVRELVDRVQGVAAARGYIRTLSGRRCRFPVSEDGKSREWLHAALNRLIQGSSADQTKQAMVALAAAGFALQLQVHDEINLSVNSAADADAVARIMETTTPLLVPSRVEAKVAANWGKAK
jgi:DNA polymerase I-like protein with 3'-5' exonuclease and polymerase domains